MEIVNTVSFFVVFVIMMILSGGWIFAIISFVTAAIIGTLIDKFIINKRLVPPSGAAVLITGCGRGIGADATLRLTSRGITVFAGVRNDSDAETLKKNAGEKAGLIVPMILDVTNQEHIASAVDVVTKYLSSNNLQLLGLVNNAGYAETSAMETITKQALQKQYDVNVFGVVEVTKAFLPLLRSSKLSQSRRIVNISSGVGKFTFAGGGPYCSTKYALESISDAFRMELSSWPIDVIIVEPGAIKTGFQATLAKTRAENLARVETKTIGDDVAERYATFGQRTAEQALKTNAKAGAPVSMVSDSIEAALFDSKPHARYLSGWDIQGLFLVRKFPDRVLDLMFGSLYSKK